MRRTSLLLLLLSWVSTFAVEAGGTPVRPGSPVHPTAVAEGLAAHDIGAHRQQPVHLLAGETAPGASIRVDAGTGPGASSSARTLPRRLIHAEPSIAATRTLEVRRLNTTLLTTRARSGFLTTISSTAPPPTHG